MHLSEIQKELTSVLMLDVDISESTISRFLYVSGFSRQKLRYVALQRDEFLRQMFILGMSVYDPDMLVFLDETGADRKEYAEEVWL